MKKKRICILQNGLKYGGTDTFVLNLINNLDDNQYDITLVLSGDNMDIIREKEIKDNIEVIKTCSLIGFCNRFKHLLQLYKILKCGNFDVFQANIDLFNGFNMFVAWLTGVKIRICHSHNSQYGRGLRDTTLKIKVYQKLMRLLCVKFSNRYTGCSESAMQFLFGKRWQIRPYSQIIYNGIYLDKYRSSSNIDKKKEEIGLKKKYNIITIGRIEYQKNPVFLAEIFGEICLLRDDCDLIWIGNGDMKEQTIIKFKEYNCLDNVHFLGVRNDISDLLYCSNLFLLPSLFEGLGIVLIEAQAAGVPCISSDVIPHEANCGGIIELSLGLSSKSWAKKISEILDKRIYVEVNKSKLENYTIDNMVKQMEGVFQSC